MNAYKLYTFDHNEEFDCPGDEIIIGIILAKSEEESIQKAVALGYDLKQLHSFIELIGPVLGNMSSISIQSFPANS